MRDIMESILENSDSVAGVTLKNNPNSSVLLLNQPYGTGRMTFHPALPGTDAGFYFCKRACVAGIRRKCSAQAPVDQLLYFRPE